MSVMEQLLGGEEGLPSALDVDVAGLGVPEPRPSVAAGGEQRLSAFDLLDEAEDGAYRWRRALGVAAVVLGSAAAVAGSVAIGL